jgi:hypothetical protein
MLAAGAGAISGFTHVPNYPCGKETKGEQHLVPAHPGAVALYCWFAESTSERWTAISTTLLAIITGLLSWIAFKQERTTRAELRAYVKLSHTSPGVSLDIVRQSVAASFQVRNAGRTPAYVTDVIVTPVVLPNDQRLPDSPRYTDIEGYPWARAFLVTGDHIVVALPFELREAAAVAKGELTLYFVGYVDYIDAFNTRHRGGYARVYDLRRDAGPIEHRNNLVFVNDSAYNYDRRRRLGEGRDWETDYYR